MYREFVRDAVEKHIQWTWLPSEDPYYEKILEGRLQLGDIDLTKRFGLSLLDLTPEQRQFIEDGTPKDIIRAIAATILEGIAKEQIEVLNQRWFEGDPDGDEDDPDGDEDDLSQGEKMTW